MFRLVRFLVTSVLLLMVCYFAVTVPIGKHTLWGHILRIARSSEAQDLADGAKDAAREAARKAQKELDETAPAPRQPSTHQ